MSDDISLSKMLEDIMPKHKIELHKVYDNMSHKAFKQIKEDTKVLKSGQLYKLTDKGRERIIGLINAANKSEWSIRFGGDEYNSEYYKNKDFESHYMDIATETYFVVQRICLDTLKNTDTLTEVNNLLPLLKISKNGVENLEAKEIIEIL